jgi:hypothetical protein
MTTNDKGSKSVFAQYVADIQPVPEANTAKSEPTQQILPAQKLLNWLLHWGKPTVCAREILIYGPRSLRNPVKALSSAETLVKYGWLVPAKKHRRDMHKWEIVRKPVIPPNVAA